MRFFKIHRPEPAARRAGPMLCFALALAFAAAAAAAPPAAEKTQDSAAPATAAAPEAAVSATATTASAPAATARKPRKTVAAAPVQTTAAKTKEKAEPPLDVATLKERLRDSKAIGFFTKLELQNQVNDLLARFRERYDKARKADVADLRQPFEMLVLKVLALLQDRDPSLAQTIAKSRDAIWNILADPEKFKLVS